MTILVSGYFYFHPLHHAGRMSGNYHQNTQQGGAVHHLFSRSTTEPAAPARQRVRQHCTNGITTAPVLYYCVCNYCEQIYNKFLL